MIYDDNDMCMHLYAFVRIFIYSVYVHAYVYRRAPLAKLVYDSNNYM